MSLLFRIGPGLSTIQSAVHSVHWGINLPQKHPPLSCQAPLPLPLNLQTVQGPFLGNPPLYIGFS